MSVTNFPRGISSFGLPVLPGLPPTTGKVFFVHKDGANVNNGEDPDHPFKTWDYAVGKCTANKNDLILLMPGHSESISAAGGVDLDVAGVETVGLGVGENRPVITFITADTADIDVDADNIKVRNVVFKNDIDAQVVMIDVNKKDFVLEDCEFREGTAKQWLSAVDVNGGAANACDRATIRRCKFTSVAAGANKAIGLEEVQDGVVIEGCVLDGDFADAGIHNPTGKVLTNLVLRNNVVRNRQTGDHAIELVSACTGEAVTNYFFADTPGLVFDPGSLHCADCWEQHKIDSAAVPSPVGPNVPGEYWIHTAKATADILTGAAVIVFTVSGGRVLVRALVGEVTTVLSGTTETLKFQSNPTTGTTTDLCAALDVGGDEVGSLYSLPDAPGTALVAGKSGSVRAHANHTVVPIGDIEALSSADLTGSIKLDIWWRPLDAGARLVAA